MSSLEFKIQSFSNLVKQNCFQAQSVMPVTPLICKKKNETDFIEVRDDDIPDCRDNQQKKKEREGSCFFFNDGHMPTSLTRLSRQALSLFVILGDP